MAKEATSDFVIIDRIDLDKASILDDMKGATLAEVKKHAEDCEYVDVDIYEKVVSSKHRLIWE